MMMWMKRMTTTTMTMCNVVLGVLGARSSGHAFSFQYLIDL